MNCCAATTTRTSIFSIPRTLRGPTTLEGMVEKTIGLYDVDAKTPKSSSLSGGTSKSVECGLFDIAALILVSFKRKKFGSPKI